MTKKPNRSTGSRYRSMPYSVVLVATWGATVLSATPVWFHGPILRVTSYVIHLVGEASR